MPQTRPRLESLTMLRDSRGQHGIDGVMERAHHAGHVAQRRAFDPPLGERPRRCAFEVDDDEVLARVQHLSQMIVAVDANTMRRDLAIDDGAKRLYHPTLRAQYELRFGRSLLRELRRTFLQLAEHSGGRIAHRL